MWQIEDVPGAVFLQFQAAAGRVECQLCRLSRQVKFWSRVPGFPHRPPFCPIIHGSAAVFHRRSAMAIVRPAAVYARPIVAGVPCWGSGQHRKQDADGARAWADTLPAGVRLARPDPRPNQADAVPQIQRRGAGEAGKAGENISSSKYVR